MIYDFFWSFLNLKQVQNETLVSENLESIFSRSSPTMAGLKFWARIMEKKSVYLKIDCDLCCLSRDQPPARTEVFFVYFKIFQLIFAHIWSFSGYGVIYYVLSV